MRVAIVHSYYSSRQPSGENVVVDAQAAALTEAGHDVHVVARRTDEEERRSLHSVRAAWTVATGVGADPTDELRAFRPDVVHVHNLFPNFGTSWLARWAGPVVATLRDKDARVRHAVVFGLPRFRGDLEKYIPTFQEMLKDPDANARDAGLEILGRLGIEAEISRADLLSFFTTSDYLVLNAAFTQLGGQHGEVSGDEALVMLQSPQVVSRLLGLSALGRAPEKQSVELALPMLRDPDGMVRLRAAQTLRMLTGQQFSEDQPDEWMSWWVKNKTNFLVQSQFEELRPSANGMAYHVRGCQNYDARNFAKALVDFRKACELGSEFQDYSRYRIWLILARLVGEEAATKELAVYLKNRKAQGPPDWPLQAGRFLAGQISEADLLKAAADANTKTDKEQHCEAYFYAGSKRLIENDQRGGVDFFKKCLGTGVTNFEEFQSAEAELKALH